MERAVHKEEPCGAFGRGRDRHLVGCFPGAVPAIWRAVSAINFMTGLSVRFFSVVIPTGPASIGRATGRIFSSRRLPLKRTMDSETTVRNRPVAIMALWN